MRIAVLSDIHANLPFAESAVRRARQHGCDKIIHLGDAIDLGPWPSETLDFLVDEEVEMIRGNHDEYPVMGMTPETEDKTPDDIKAHMEWTASQLRPDHHTLLATLPTTLVAHIDEWFVRFQHFLLDGNRISERMVRHDPAVFLEEFEVAAGEIVCFGHIHTRLWHFTGDRGILNPGATGFCNEQGAWFATLVLQNTSAWIEWHPVTDTSDYVVSELEKRRVPAWESSANYMFATAG